MTENIQFKVNVESNENRTCMEILDNNDRRWTFGDIVNRLNALHEECLQYLNIIGDIRVYAKENDIENILKIINKLEMELIENV